MPLTAEDFTDFYHQVHGARPFPWQRDLVATVLQEGRWPALVDVPTGLGKTSMLDAAVFICAATASQPGAARLGRRRCFFVVDRRIVVDEATEHAQLIVQKLETAHRRGDTGALGKVAAGLRSLAPDASTDQLLAVTKMRGGTTWAASWLQRPDLPGLVIGTVDQVGSRLLFRGYGVSDRRRPIDAALVGTDALLLVDEAHLATALLDTLTAVGRRDRLGLPLPGLDIVRLTATAGPSAEPFPQIHAGQTAQANVPWQYVIDIDAHADDAEAIRRLTAAKDLYLVNTVVKTCPRVMADIAVGLADTAPGVDNRAASVVVVCNTVDRARAVHTLIDKAITGRDRHRRMDLDLLIGRSRPCDRVDLVKRVLSHHGVGRTATSRPAILVATQTVEVGVNLDADALVTESASWDALVQRLGRLNRLGRYNQRFPDRVARAVVVHDGETNGPVYRAARDVTWQQLCTLTRVTPDPVAEPQPGLSVSPLDCRNLTATLPKETLAPRPQTPVLQVPTLDAWVATAPVPLADPPVDVFLHGFATGRAGVTLAWRDGLTCDNPVDDPFDDFGEQPAPTANLLLAAIPIRASEQMEVPYMAVRQWMEGLTPAPISDVESAPDLETRPRQDHDPFRVLAWRSDPANHSSRSRTTGAWVWIDHDQLRPGDQVVVPTERGGLDDFGWNPQITTRVRDVSEQVAFHTGHPLLRLDDKTGQRLGLPDQARRDLTTTIRALGDVDLTTDTTAAAGMSVLDSLRAALAGFIDNHPEVDQPLSMGMSPGQILAWIDSGPRLIAITDQSDEGQVIGGTAAQPTILWWLLVGGISPVMPSPHTRSVAAATDRSSVGELMERDDDDDPTSSSISLQWVGLDQHQREVCQRAGQIATALRLPTDLVATIQDAASWHDLGKVEDRFQIMLHDGDPCMSALATQALAKSGMDPQDRSAWRAARASSGLPIGARHEAWSAALVRAYLTQRSTAYSGDGDLLIHLVASHHGYARPWMPLVIDHKPHPVTATIDGAEISVPSQETVPLEHPGRFAALNDRYGRWGLALLETIVRCADMTVSSEGS